MLRPPIIEAGLTKQRILIHGKGKWWQYRQVSWHPETPIVLEELRIWRNRETATARAKNPKVKVPEICSFMNEAANFMSTPRAE